MIQFRTLGSIELVGPPDRDLQPILVGPKRLALLAYLALATPRGFHRKDTLLGLFWPELDQPHARRALRNLTHEVRVAVGPGVLVNRGDDELALDRGRLWCDAAAFEEALAAGDLERASELYRGVLLEGFFVSGAPEFEFWLARERDRLHRCALEAAGRLSAREEALGHTVEAVRWARRAAALAPYEEGPLRELAALLDRCGDRVEAVRAYDEFERRLAQDLELAPSPETQALIEAVRVRGEGSVPTGATAASKAVVETRGAPRMTAALAPAGPGDAVILAPDAPAADRRRPSEQIERGRFPRVNRRRAVLGGAAGLAVVLALAGLYVRGHNRLSGSDREPVATGSAPGLAVLPFRVVGPDLELWREGMVDLLSLNLDGTAGLRTSDPRAILSRWRTEFGDGNDPADRLAGLRVARALGAKHALVGTMVELGGKVRLSAQLYDAQTRTLEGEAQVEGLPDSLLALVDRLSVEVLRAGLAGQGTGLSPLNSRRVTTPSLPALKAYLAGEQALRHIRTEEAISSFTRAVEADSSFALGWYRLSLAYGWAGFDNLPNAIETGDRAARLADRLPERDRLLFLGMTDLEKARPEAIETLEKVTARWPDDAEAWYVLADAYFHLGPPRFYPYERFRDASRRASELDPGFGPVYLHAVEGAFAQEDSAEAGRLVRAWRRLDPSKSEPQFAYTLVWGDSLSRSNAAAALDTTSIDDLTGSAYYLMFSPSFSQENVQVARAVLRRDDSVEARQWGQWNIYVASLSRGRLSEARAARLAIPGEDMVVRVASFTLSMHLLGYPDSSAAREAARILSRNPEPFVRFLLGALAANDGRWADVEDQIRAFESRARNGVQRPDSLRLFDGAAAAEALRGYAAARRGDRLAAIRELRKALAMFPGECGIHFDAACYMHPWLRLELGRLLLEAGQPREADRYLKTFWGYLWHHSWGPVSALFAPLDELYLGQAAEALGDMDEARQHYARFVAWWKDCDPELRPLWEKGRQGLERVTGAKKL